MLGPAPASVGEACANYGVDPMSTLAFTRLQNMSSATSTAIEAMATYPVGDIIHCATQIATGAVYYNQYNTTTNAWVLATSETVAAAASFAPTTGSTFVDLVVRSNGEVVIFYCAGLTAMSSGFNMLRYRRRTGTNTYTTATNVDNGGSINWTGGVCALGASDRVHFFFKDATNNDAYQRTLSAANALQTFPAAFDTTAAVTATIAMFGNAASYVDAGTTKVRAPYRDSSNRIAIAQLDSADAPTVTTTSVSGTSPDIFTSNGQAVLQAAMDGTTIHTLLSDNTSFDLMHNSSAGGGGAWGTDVNELAGTINHITDNVYVRSGATVLAMVLDNAGTVRYAEIELAAAPPPATPPSFVGMVGVR